MPRARARFRHERIMPEAAPKWDSGKTFSYSFGSVLQLRRSDFHLRVQPHRGGPVCIGGQFGHENRS
jgi:hypothetical protein